MGARYDCEGNRWVNNLHSLREKWCHTFLKKNFSREVLSSQRSESTNNLIKRRLCTTATLCDFYNIFCGVISDWRDKENGEHHKCSKGNVEIALPSVKGQRSTKIAPLNADAILSGAPLCMNVLYAGLSSQGNVVPTLNLLSNSNPNDRSLCQSTIAAVRYCPPFPFDQRIAGGLASMMFQ
ncbi:hypothetical protein Cgig2_002750 [Carnegiea gigantea]|uniref:Protein FAR1-RELATED SEQUENCE n=1 Tax=Carnegiea gigantea TaxID=171969 RepID=A0A9Q1GZJ4_9CARY|nr:hypothetical protein Cgig2_002750 [Carnegiea gigantea]